MQWISKKLKETYRKGAEIFGALLIVLSFIVYQYVRLLYYVNESIFVC